MSSSEFSHSRYIPAKWVGVRQGVDVCPQFDCPSPELVLCRGDVSLCFCYAHCHCKECPYDCLCSYPLDPVDGSHKFVLEGMHPYIRGIVHHWGDCGCEQLSHHRWGQAPESP